MQKQHYAQQAGVTAPVLWRCWEVPAVHKLLPILRVLKMTAFCMAVVAVPVACTVLTGYAPVDCEVAFCD